MPWIALAVLALDQITKALVSLRLTEGQAIPLLPGILYLTRVHNYGGAFGILNYQTGFFVLVGLAVLTGIGLAYVQVVRHRSRLLGWALALAWGGAAGNLVDRVRLGYVVDFLDLRVWPVFNVADIALVAGIGLMAWETLRQARQEGADCGGQK
ncbi:MAG: signal peptidase II [Clostridia bacterium]|nr:signal peptidase II [Clostridia bacterium]MDH7573278.1 signal peptidase II [Clostridia bacterium]